MAIPRLRFKEFDRDWEQSSLAKLTNYFKGYAFKSESYKQSGVRIIRVSDLGRERIKYDNDAIYLDESKKSNYEKWVIKKDDIVITTVGSKPHLVDSAVGRPIYLKNDNEGLLNQNLLVLRPIEQKINAYFIYSQLQDQRYLTHIESIQRGNANQSNITVKELQEFKLFNTLEEEQNKIASFLSAVDDKIAQLTQEHELLSEYKKGMMQQLFSQKLRFKADDSSGFIDWKEEKLGDCIEVFDHLRIPVTASERISGSTPYYGANGIQSYIDGYTHDGEFVLIAEDGANDVLNYPVQYVSGKIWVNNHAHVVRGKQGILNNYFLVYRISSTNITRYLVGGGRPKLNAKAMKEILFAIPCLAEQTKIANFLSAIDQKIDNVAAQIDQAQVWKKGLLQQMFV